MARTNACLNRCPFSGNPCTECGLYRGRHHYFISARPKNGNGRAATDQVAQYFQALEDAFKPLMPKGDQSELEGKIILTVVNMETRQNWICDFDEAKTWDWGDPTIMRLIDGWHVKSFANLMDILTHKVKEGRREVELHEFPRFMLLSGG